MKTQKYNMLHRTMHMLGTIAVLMIIIIKNLDTAIFAATGLLLAGVGIGLLLAVVKTATLIFKLENKRGN